MRVGNDYINYHTSHIHLFGVTIPTKDARRPHGYCEGNLAFAALNTALYCTLVPIMFTKHMS
jgi:hypothetical protein